MSVLIKPTVIPATEQIQRLNDSIATLALRNELSVNWIRIITDAWERARDSMLARETANNTDLGSVVLSLSQAGANACAAGAEESTGFKQYEWMRAGHAHRDAMHAIMVGWPPNRPVAQSIPTEFANLRATPRRPFIGTAGDQYLLTLNHDPLGIPSKSYALSALEVIAVNTYLDGMP